MKSMNSGPPQLWEMFLPVVSIRSRTSQPIYYPKGFWKPHLDLYFTGVFQHHLLQFFILFTIFFIRVFKLILSISIRMRLLCQKGFDPHWRHCFIASLFQSFTYHFSLQFCSSYWQHWIAASSQQQRYCQVNLARSACGGPILESRLWKDQPALFGSETLSCDSAYWTAAQFGHRAYIHLRKYCYFLLGRIHCILVVIHFWLTKSFPF